MSMSSWLDAQTSICKLKSNLGFSLKSSALAVIYVLRNAHLEQLKSSTCQRHWTKTQPIAMGPTLSNYTGYQSLGQGKFLVWLEPMALGSQLPSKFLLNPPAWQEILTYFQGSELQSYFVHLLEDKLKAVIKPQYVEHIPKVAEGNVRELLK